MAELEIIGPEDHAGVQICRMLCIEKGIPYKYREVAFGSRAAQRENGYGYLPALRHGKIRLFTVRGITSYIDKRFGGRSLIPSDVIRAAEVAQWIAFCETRLSHLLKGKNREAWKTCVETNTCLDYLAESMGSRQWLVGRGFTLADLWLMPAIHAFVSEVGEQELLRQQPAIGLWYDKHTTRKSWMALAKGTAQASK